MKSLFAFQTVTELSRLLKNKEISAVELAQFYLKRIEQHDTSYNSYITVVSDQATERAEQIDKARIHDEPMHQLAGIPFGVKDAICTAGIRSTAAAKILDNYVPPYDATVIQKLRDHGAIVLGKHNCDAFGHGASNENSDYGAVLNPWDIERVAGGSSGGSGAAVVADLCAFAIGEDTGGSIRAPSAFCGISGLKVSYGRNSRYGCMPMASSLDTVGPMARSVEDLALIQEAIAGHDSRDATTADVPVPNYLASMREPITGKKIGIPKEYFSDALPDAIRLRTEEAIRVFEDLGASVVSVSLPHTQYAIATYYVLVPSEDSSNMARFDGIRYGIRAEEPTLRETYLSSRTNGLPKEVKRRIMIGTFALSHGYYDAYYLKAQKVRTLIKNDFDTVFKKVDALITPTAPEIAFKIGEKINDPLKMYLSDVYVGPSSLAGVCALSIPCGFVDNLPIGLQIIGPSFKEEIPLRFGFHYQQATNWHTHHPQML